MRSPDGFHCQASKCGNKCSLMLTKRIQECFTPVIESITDFLGLVLSPAASLPAYLNSAYLLRAKAVLSLTRGKEAWLLLHCPKSPFHVRGS